MLAHLHAWIFIGAISLPLALNLAGVDGADPAAEKRELAAFPRLAPSWTSIAAFPGGVDRWFSDHFGLRANLVRWHAASRLFLLRTSPASAVLLGRDGWLFYADDGALEDYTNQRPLDEAELQLWRETITRTRRWLRARGIAHVFTLTPDKHVIYPEHFPSDVRQTSPTSRMDQVLRLASAGSAGGEIVDLRPLLVAAKAQDRLYHRADTHWNARGAFAAYCAIIEALRAQRPDVPPPSARSDFVFVTRTRTGMDLAALLGLPHALQEEDLALEPKRPLRARVVDPPGATLDDAHGYLVTEIPDSTLPRAVVFRDSFAAALAPFLSEHFSRTVYLWQNDFDAAAVTREKADVVIQQMVGRHLHTYLPTPDLIPD
jgi:hypothetical protein